MGTPGTNAQYPQNSRRAKDGESLVLEGVENRVEVEKQTGERNPADKIYHQLLALGAKERWVPKEAERTVERRDQAREDGCNPGRAR